MKKEYYSTFIPGLETPVENMLRKTGGIAVRRIMPGAAIYRSVHEPRLLFTQRSFELLCELRHEPTLDAALRRLSGTDAWLDRFDFDHVSGMRFRIVTAEDGQPKAANMRFVSMIEKSICEQTGMLVNRERPQVELWVNLRQEGVYFLWRLRSGDLPRSTDPLRRDLCEVLAYAAAPQGGSTAILGLTGDNLCQGLLSQGAATVQAVYADHVKGQPTQKNTKMHILPGTPGHTGLPEGSQKSVLLCLPPKGTLAIQEEDIRSSIHEAISILKPGGRLVGLYPKEKGRAFRKIAELNLMDQIPVTLSGETCFIETWAKPQ